MVDLEIPLTQRSKTKLYRFFEMVPAIASYGILIVFLILSFVNSLAASIFLLLFIITYVVKAAVVARDTIVGNHFLKQAQHTNWHERLLDLEDPITSYEREKGKEGSGFKFELHQENLRLMAADPASYPKPSEIYNLVIIAAYNESIDVLEPTLQSVLHSTYDNDHLIIALAYEARGGKGMKDTARELEKKFKTSFFQFFTIEHPANLPHEVVGKGGNITYAARILQNELDQLSIPYKNVIVTTLDSDNKPHQTYFDYVTYEYIVHDDRKHLSFQPVSLYLNNIWDAPAPMRVIATGNSFWNIIVSMRPHNLRNFASHSQPMEALVEMNFWSTRTIVEDGHQYWRSWFYFGGNYSVIPIHVPIYQDAVLSQTYRKTLYAQFKQLRRWAYGASDVPYVATRIFTKKRNVNLLEGIWKLYSLIDSHVTLACISILVTVGGWVPLYLNSDASRSIAAHQLPIVVSYIERVATVGLIIMVFFSLKMLPPRPERYKRHRTIFMVLQWFLMPLTSICYSAIAAFNAQTRLLFGKYLDKFDVTEKATYESTQKAKAAHVSSSK